MKKSEKDENIEALLRGISSLTYRIHVEGEDTHSMASGFFWQVNSAGPIVFITAGHKIEGNEILINSRITNSEDKPLLVYIGKFTVFNSDSEGDFAFCILKEPEHKKLKENFPDLAFHVYQGTFPKPIKDQAYSFAVDNNGPKDFVKINKDLMVLHRYWCFESWMDFECSNGLFHHFNLARDHQGHEYYQGASGSPVVDDQGLITAILVGPSEETKKLGLMGMNMKTIVNTISQQMNKPTNTNQIVPILGELKENGEVEYIGSGFIIKWVGDNYLCSAGHVFMPEDYSAFFYSIDGNLINISLEELQYDATNAEGKRDGTDRTGVKHDYAFLKIDTQIEGLTLCFDTIEYGDSLEYRGYSPISQNDVASQANYIERTGTHDSDEDFAYSGVPIGGGRSVKIRLDNIRLAIIEGCIQGNSGGPILKEGTNDVVGLLTNGIDESLIYITSDYLLEKLIEHFK